MKYFCPVCDEPFDDYDEMDKHFEICPKRLEELSATQKVIEKKRQMVLSQDSDKIAKSILYTTSDTTIAHLVQIYGYPMAMTPGAYRKWHGVCPHCDYEMDEEIWRKPEYLKEVSAVVDKFTLDTVSDERFILISECPKCGKKSIRHAWYKTLLKCDWIDKKKILEWLKLRGVEINYD